MLGGRLQYSALFVWGLLSSVAGMLGALLSGFHGDFICKYQTFSKEDPGELPPRDNSGVSQANAGHTYQPHETAGRGIRTQSTGAVLRL